MVLVQEPNELCRWDLVACRQDPVHQVGRLLIHAPARAEGQMRPLQENGARPAAGCALETNKAKAGVATWDDRAELALDEARQRMPVVVAAGDEVAEVLAQEPDERADLRLPRHIGTRSAGADGLVMPLDVCGLRIALHVGTRRAMAIRHSVRGSSA